MTITTGRGIAVTGPKLVYTADGKRCYAYSGVIDPATGEVTYLEFTTSNETIKGTIEVNADWAGGGGNNFSIKIYLNGVNVVYERDTANNYVAGTLEFHFILPPVTTLKVDLGGLNADANANFTGTVYEEP